MRSRSTPSAVTTTHGWRWWRIEGNQLVSPFADAALPRHGAIRDAYFIPHTTDMWRVVLALQMGLPELHAPDFAISYGTVHGAVEPDADMRHLGSMRAQRYHVRTILTDSAADLSENYDAPITRGVTTAVDAGASPSLTRGDAPTRFTLRSYGPAQGALLSRFADDYWVHGPAECRFLAGYVHNGQDSLAGICVEEIVDG